MPTIINTKDLTFKEDPSSIATCKIQTADPRLSKIAESEHLIFDI